MTRTYSSPANWRHFFAIHWIIASLIFYGVVHNTGYGQTTVTYSTAGTYSWTCPIGVTSVDIEVWGAGGAGGGPTTNGTGGGGGGGGAYRKVLSVAVTPGVNYSNAIVVGAGGVGGTGNGAAGQQSSVTLGSPYTANGGGGGTAAGVGGTGGTGGTFNGGSGSNGISGSDQGGGGGGSAGTGSNGNTVSVSYLGASAVTGGGPGGNGANAGNNNTNGTNPASAPGGGGGGGFSKTSNVSGGSGSAGKVALTYTCPVYILTSVAASPVCINGGSSITLTGNTSNLPVGTYTVIYDQSAPNSVAGATATMVVSTAGSGSFSTTALAGIGNTTITIKSLSRSSECVSNLSSNNTATIVVNPLPQGSLTSTGSICGSGSGALTWTATAGTGPYTIVYNDGVANRTATNVTSGVPFSVFSNPVTSTTSYTLVSVAGANCTRTSGFTGGSATITVYPLPQGSLTANGPFCATGSGTLTWTATAGTGPYTIVYNDGVADRTANNVTSGSPFAVFTTPVTSTTSYTLVSATGVNCQRTSGFTNGSATITISSPATTSNPGPNQTGSATCGLTSVTLAANTPTVGTGAWSIIAGTGGVVTTPSSPASSFSGTAGNTYTLRWTITPAAPCPASFNDVQVMFNQVPSIITSQTASVCNGVGFSVTPTTTGGNVIPAGTNYSWGLPSLSGSLTGATSGTAAPNISGTLSQTGTSAETATYTVTPATSLCTGSSFPVTVYVQPTPVLTSTLAPTAICSSNSANFSYTATSATSGVSYSWSRAAIASINSNSAGSGTGASISETLTSSSTSAVNVVYVITMTINGCSNTQNVTLTVNPRPILTSALSFAKCNNVPLAYTATSATSGVSFSWSRAAVPGISNAANSGTGASINETLMNSTSAPVTNIVYQITLTANGCSNTQNVTVTIQPTPTASASPNTQIICSGGTASFLFNETVSSTSFAWGRDNPAGITYTGGIAAGTGTTNASTAVSGTLTNTLTTAVDINFFVTPSANGCNASQQNNVAKLTVLPVPTVNAVSGQNICRGGAVSAINFSGNATSFTWTNSNTGIGLAAASGTGNIASFTAVNNTSSLQTSNFSVVPVYTSGATSCNGTPQNFTINVLPDAVLSSATSGLTTCSGSVFSYTPSSSATGITTTFSWTRAAVAGINSNTAAAGTGNPNEVLSITNGSTSNINVTYVYSVTSTFNGNSCTNPTTYNVTVAVKPTPTIATAPNGSLSICHGVTNNFAGVTLSNPNALSGTALSWNRDNNVIIGGLNASGSGNVPAASLTNSLNAIQYTLITAMASLNGCSSTTNVNVQVNPPITNDINSSTVLEADICNITKQVSIDAPAATGGNGIYTYQWQFSSPGGGSFSDLPGETGEDLIYNYTIANAFFRRIATSDACTSVISDEIHVNGPVTNSVTLATGNNISYCANGVGASISLNGTVNGATYYLQRNTGGSTWVNENPPAPIIGTGLPITFSGITTAGTYRVSSTITTPSACTQVIPGTVSVSIDPLPNAPTVNSPAAICQGASTNIVGTRNALDGNNVTVNWYAAATGGSPFNASSNPNTYTVSPAATSTYYAEAINNNTLCVNSTRTPVLVTVRPLPVMTSGTTTALCSGNTFSFPLSASNSPDYFTWQAANNTNVSGLNLTAFNTSAINNNGAAITNNTNTAQVITYSVVPRTNSPACSGATQLVYVTIDPRPVVVTTQSAVVCGGNPFTITPANGGGNIIPSTPATNYTWAAPTGTGFTGGAANSTPASSITGTLSNAGNTATTATYSVTPVAGACSGNPFTATVTINPRPLVKDTVLASCSPISISLTPANGYGSTYIVPSGTTYSWPLPSGSNISGIASGTNQSSITGNITNTSSPGALTAVQYTVTPTGPSGLGSCIGTPFVVTANIYPNPTGAIAGTTSVCQGGASPNITFTGFNGTQPYTFTYDINGGSPQTATTSSGNSITVPVPTTTAGTYTYRLSRVADASPTGCFWNYNNPVTVTVNPTATATLSGNPTICAGGSATLSISIPAGSGTYTGTLSPGGTSFSGTAPNLSVIVMPGSTTTYSIASISGTCTSTAGSATVTIPSGTPGVWTCSVSNDWFDCRNWANGTVPDNLTNVTISTPNSCNPVINPNSSFAPADKIARAANILISGTANLSFNGAGNLYVAGNWTNTVGPAGFTAGTSTVSFMGSSGAGCTQTVNTTAGNSENFYNLVINNTCNRDAAGQGDNVTLSSPVNVGGTLMLTDGIVKTSSTNLLTITNPAVAAVSNGSAASYINGPIARLTNSTGTYIFPTGNPAAPAASGVYRPATVTPVSSSPTSFTAQYFPTYAPEYNTSKLGVTGILETEYWDIRPTGACSVEAVIGLPYVNPGSAASWTGNMGPCATCNVAIAKPVFTSSNSWYFTDYPTYSGTGFNGSIPEDRAYNNNGWIYSKPITCAGFSSPHFTFGFNYNNILPTQLISFEGKLVDADAKLVWIVTDTKELAGFELEHSGDGNNFKKIAAIPPGNDNHYQYIDARLTTGPHYYRLALRDKQGKIQYSRTVLLVVGNNLTLIKGLRANPVNETAHVDIWSGSAQYAKALIFDMTGRLIDQQTWTLSAGKNDFTLRTSGLAQGVYNLFIKTEDGALKNIRMVKE